MMDVAKYQSNNDSVDAENGCNFIFK